MGASCVACLFIVYMPRPLPRRSVWASYFAHSPSRISLPRKGHRVGLRIVLFEACSAFTHVAACTLALSPIRDTLSEGFSQFVTSMPAPVASGWSGRRVGLAPTGKRRLFTAHTQSGQKQSPDFHLCGDLFRANSSALVRYDHGLIILAGSGGAPSLSCKLDECLD